MSLMTPPWQVAGLVAAVIFGIAGFLANEGRRSWKPEIALVAAAIIGYLAVWFIYLVVRRVSHST